MAVPPDDALLKAVVAGLKRHVRASDVVARLGGDEFAVLLWNLDAARARAKARELETAIAGTEVTHAAVRLSVGASAGSVTLAADATPAAILEAADQAMYARKRREEPKARVRRADALGAAYGSGNYVWRELIVDGANLVAQHQLALLQPLHLNEIGTRRQSERRNRRVEVAVLLLQARQLFAQRALFFAGHRYRWLGCARYRLSKTFVKYCVFHRTVQAARKTRR